MPEPKGVGDSSFEKMQPPSQMGGPSEGGGGENIEAALHTKVRTLGELKQLLIDKLGEKKGKKMYNTLIKSIALGMLHQMQHAAQQAKKSAQEMRQDKG